MYKLNGEETMTREESIRLRAEVAERRRERERATELIAEALGTDMYSSLMHFSDPRDRLIEAVSSGRE